MDMNVSTSKNFCQICSTKKSYNEQYDAYYCNQCNEWSEPTCDDPRCEYCTIRPQKPKD